MPDLSAPGFIVGFGAGLFGAWQRSGEAETSVHLIKALQSQLDRCGPENLGKSPVACPGCSCWGVWCLALLLFFVGVGVGCGVTRRGLLGEGADAKEAGASLSGAVRSEPDRIEGSPGVITPSGRRR